ncbi:MAG: SET domain-containing protein-lysine N-methyltransferase [Devosia sp.]|nr:SET domain-containing protein-lysine N-methyltransferase [Devosia sp.]
MTEPLDLPRHSGIAVTEIPGRGWGVVAIEPILKGELIEASPVIRLPPEASPPRTSPLFDYVFAWDEAPFIEAVALGIVSLVNHAAAPCATIECDHVERTIRLLAARDIEAGEEITIDYGIPLWFEAS